MVIHPAFQIPFDALHQGLEDRVQQGLILKKTDGAYSLYHYSAECQYSRNWDEFTLMARGLVLDTNVGRIAACGFPKFFNLGETPDQIRDLPFTVTPKMDGSLGICFYCPYQDKWRIITKGSFNSEQSQVAQSMLDSALPEGLDPLTCYLWEIIYPQNRIVVDYGNERFLTLLGGYDLRTGQEHNVLDSAFPIGEMKPSRYTRLYEIPFASVEALKAAMREPFDNREGWILRYDDGYRIKVKLEEYVQLHRIVSNITPLGVWDALRTGADVEATIKSIPEEFQKDYRDISDTLLGQYYNALNKSGKIYENYKHLPRKEFCLTVQEHHPDTFNWAISLYANGGIANDKMSQSIWKAIRPTRNILDGYKPSSSINRFQQQDDS